MTRPFPTTDRTLERSRAATGIRAAWRLNWRALRLGTFALLLACVALPLSAHSQNRTDPTESSALPEPSGPAESPALSESPARLSLLPAAASPLAAAQSRQALLAPPARLASFLPAAGFIDAAEADPANPTSESLIARLGANPGAAFLSSAVLPGSAQLAQRNPVRGAFYLAVEAVALAVHADQIRKARDGESAYERYADGNWSVVRYAQWLVGYHAFHDLANPYIDELAQQVTRLRPAGDTSIDWPAVPISLLRDVERNTLYIYGMVPGRNNFSHVMPDYGSQQYYELISKYYQYGPGWSDFPAEKFTLPWDGTEMTDQFYLGRDRAERFNDQYRTASNMVSVVILNHLFAAFDAYFTAKVRQTRVQLAPPVSMAQPLRMRMDF